MSLIVRHKDTGYFLQSHDSWTNHLDHAMQFNSGLRLVDYIEHGGVTEESDHLEVLVIPPFAGTMPLSEPTPLYS